MNDLHIKPALTSLLLKRDCLLFFYAFLNQSVLEAKRKANPNVKHSKTSFTNQGVMYDENDLLFFL